MFGSYVNLRVVLSIGRVVALGTFPRDPTRTIDPNHVRHEATESWEQNN